MLLLFSVLALNQASICPSRTLAVIIIFTSVTFDTGGKGRQVCLAPPPVIVTLFMCIGNTRAHSGSTGQEQQNKEINEIPTSDSFWQEDKKGTLPTAEDSQEEKIYEK